MYYGYTLLMYSPHIIDVLLMQSRCIIDALLMYYSRGFALLAAGPAPGLVLESYCLELGIHHFHDLLLTFQNCKQLNIRKTTLYSSCAFNQEFKIAWAWAWAWA